METTKFNTRLNIMDITSIHSFAGIRGGGIYQCKDVYFIRYIGSEQNLVNEIESMDKLLAIREIQEQGNYIRFSEFPKLVEPNDIVYYTNIYDKWEQSGRNNIEIKAVKDNNQVKAALSDALKSISIEFEKNTPLASNSINRNFVIKIIYWTDVLIGKMIREWDGITTNKIVFLGKLKKQEYLFLFYLTKLGIDVMLISPDGEINIEKKLLDLSECIKCDMNGEVKISEYDINNYKMEQTEMAYPKNDNLIEQGLQVCDSIETQYTRIKIKLPPRDRRNLKNTNVSQSNSRAAVNATTTNSNQKNEMKFEELAMFGSSVVMISVHDKRGKVFATGSGIMISNKGYILTNNHVTSGGHYYSVRIEDENEIYKTDELIKYNQDLDLALIRINRSCTSIPIYKGEKALVRGQMVVAIGSPLGLFNSISNGIISGFRKIDDVDMIQFTAPTSHGSSGGAVLNMQGEVIGISTAGFDSGQNINLAVDYKCITEFIRGFI
ncbi:MAG: trypsin-like peptidase domain-containing protein [Lachnotalea sp.]